MDTGKTCFRCSCLVHENERASGRERHNWECDCFALYGYNFIRSSSFRSAVPSIVHILMKLCFAAASLCAQQRGREREKFTRQWFSDYERYAETKLIKSTRSIQYSNHGRAKGDDEYPAEWHWHLSQMPSTVNICRDQRARQKSHFCLLLSKRWRCNSLFMSSPVRFWFHNIFRASNRLTSGTNTIRTSHLSASCSWRTAWENEKCAPAVAEREGRCAEAKQIELNCHALACINATAQTA